MTHCGQSEIVPIATLRMLAQPCPAHALGDLTDIDRQNVRIVAGELMVHRLNDGSALRGHWPERLVRSAPCERVPQDVLQEIARPGPSGPLTEIECAFLSMYFEDMCGELLAYRLLAKAEGAA